MDVNLDLCILNQFPNQRSIESLLVRKTTTTTKKQQKKQESNTTTLLLLMLKNMQMREK